MTTPARIVPGPPPPQSGAFIYRIPGEQETRINVTDCPTPNRTRLILEEELLGVPVRWERRAGHR